MDKKVSTALLPEHPMLESFPTLEILKGTGG
jgi:hypothetical protein